MSVTISSSLSHLATEMDRRPGEQVALMLRLYDAFASAESLLALQSTLVCACVCLSACVCGWAGDREDFRSIQPLLAPSLLLLGFDLSGVGATLQRDTT